jgi:hypothetical protein
VLNLTADASKPLSKGSCRDVDSLGCIFRSPFGYPWRGPRSNPPIIYLAASRRTGIGYASGAFEMVEGILLTYIMLRVIAVLGLPLCLDGKEGYIIVFQGTSRRRW